MQILNLDRLKVKLAAMGKKFQADGGADIVVGATQRYALIVHENLQAHHPVGQAKFLEQPARELSNDGTFSAIVEQAVENGDTLEEGFLLCGLRLQREAQKLTPIDTGALRASFFTAKYADLDTAAAAANAAGEAVRAATMKNRGGTP